ncbi:MAG: biotin/lipoyl-binding protein, partial [Acidobacteriota bacterium]
MKGSFRKIIVLSLAASAIVAGVAAWKYLSSRAASDELVLSGTVEADEIHIGSKVGGRISEVLVREGQTVKRGDVILRFESFDLDAKRADAAAAVAQAQANLEKLINGSRPEEIAQAREQAEAARISLEMARNGPRRQEIDAARAEVEAAQADFEIARTSLARIEQLTKSGVTSRQDYDSAKSTFDRAAARRESARQRLALLEAGTRDEEIRRAERQYKQAQANLEMVERGPRR